MPLMLQGSGFVCYPGLIIHSWALIQARLYLMQSSALHFHPDGGFHIPAVRVQSSLSFLLPELQWSMEKKVGNPHTNMFIKIPGSKCTEELLIFFLFVILCVGTPDSAISSLCDLGLLLIHHEIICRGWSLTEIFEFYVNCLS